MSRRVRPPVGVSVTRGVEILTREDYATDAARLARSLLGRVLVRRIGGARLSGVIVETEAYVGVRDRASHAFGGRRTARNEAMYGPPGTVYVYFTYGMHFCFNVVCARDGVPEAVLVRALMPVDGVDVMRAHTRADPRAGGLEDERLAAWPARLCRALGIGRACNGVDLCVGGGSGGVEDGLWIERGASAAGRHAAVAGGRVLSGPRIGIASAGRFPGGWDERPLRFWIAEHPSVSVRASVAGKKAADRSAARRLRRTDGP